MDWPHLLLGFDGRIGRRPFWIAFVVLAGLELVCHLLVQSFDQGERLSAIVSLAFLYPEFAVFAKRAHDRNIPLQVIGAFFALSVLMDFIVVLGLGGGRTGISGLLAAMGLMWVVFAVALLVELGVRRGTPGPNRHGPDPLA